CAISLRDSENLRSPRAIRRRCPFYFGFHPRAKRPRSSRQKIPGNFLCGGAPPPPAGGSPDVPFPPSQSARFPTLHTPREASGPNTLQNHLFSPGSRGTIDRLYRRDRTMSLAAVCPRCHLPLPLHSPPACPRCNPPATPLTVSWWSLGGVLAAALLAAV